MVADVEAIFVWQVLVQQCRKVKIPTFEIEGQIDTQNDSEAVEYDSR